MADSDSQPRFRQRTEAARERDVFRQLHPWASEYDRRGVLDRLAFPADHDQPLPDAAPCLDTALIAFAQLVAFRLAARRCLVTLVSSTVEYVLVDATKSLGLQYDTVQDPADAPWLGTCSFLRDDGLNHAAMHEWRRARQAREPPAEADHYYTEGSSPHWHIISDVRQQDALAQHSFVLRSRNLRFYASVPLRGAMGSVLGSLTVLDDNPRYGLSATEMSFMEDVADTVTQHLNATLVRAQRQRSERMVQSLGLFNDGQSSLRHWWLKQEDARISNAGRRNNAKMRPSERTAAADKEFGPKVGSSSDKDTSSSHDESRPHGPKAQRGAVTSSFTTLQNTRTAIVRDHEHVSSRDMLPEQHEHPGHVPPSAAPLKRLVRTQTANTRKDRAVNIEFDFPTASRQAYARASNLIREAIGADGVVFVDASSSSSKNRFANNSGIPGGSASDNTGHASSDGEHSERISQKDEPCSIQAFSTIDESSVRGLTALSQGFELPEHLLTTLLRRYPNGHVFSFSADGVYCPSSTDESLTSASGSNSDRSKARRMPRHSKRLAGIMPGARSIAFYPIWDEGHDRFSSCALVWSTSPLRYFDPAEEITYLASWGHSILAELGRLETIAADMAKGSFISSVSHELRSPLHGVLAGVEFLQGSELTSFQQEMTHTISMAGRALLNTVNHILDYAKMSSFTRAQRRQRATADALRNSSDIRSDNRDPNEIGVTQDVDIARLTEDIIETAVSAHRYQASRSPSIVDLSITLDIPWRRNWVVKLSPGGWTRIVQNLVGNALKYTAKGLVSVRMETVERTEDLSDNRGSDDQEHLHIRFTVEDSGTGISKEFLAHHLYTPFKQENSHSSGTGLGLSIVQQICRDMSAELNITSERGKGTRAVVDLYVKLVADEMSKHDGKARASSEASDLDVGSYHWITPLTNERVTDTAVGASVMDTAQSWLDCKTSQGPSTTSTASPRVYAITDTALASWVAEGSDSSKKRMALLASALRCVFVLSCSLQSVSSVVSLEDLPFTAVLLHQPIGPQKLLRAVSSGRSSTQLKSFDSRRGSSLPGLEPNHQLTSSSNSRASFTNADTRAQASRGSSSGVGSTGSAAIASAVPSTPQEENDEQSTGTRPSQSPHAGRTDTAPAQIADNSDHDRGPRMNTVLLVEDNDINMNLLVALMRKQKVQYACAANGREAVDIYAANPSAFFLVLMDMNMPVMDGFAATALIRETEESRRLRRSVIVALTGVTSQEAKEKAFACGVDEFFSKPVHLQELRELIAKAMGGRERV